MSYSYDRPDARALDELDTLVRNLLDELAGWRRRCLKAEAELQHVSGATGVSGRDVGAVRARVAELEAENVALRQRADAARDRLRAILGRIAFLEEQAGGAA